MVVYARYGAHTEDCEPAMDMMEREAPYSEAEVFGEFAEAVLESKKSLKRAISDIRGRGKTIAGIGAPMKSSTLLNFCKIGPTQVKYLCETNGLKVGTWSPGMHIPVVSESEFFAHPPDVALILSWNMSSIIVKKFRERGFGGSFLIPMGTVEELV